MEATQQTSLNMNREYTDQLFHKSHVVRKIQHHISQLNQRRNPVDFLYYAAVLKESKLVMNKNSKSISFLQLSFRCQSNRGNLLMQSLQLLFHQQKYVVQQH